MHLPSKVSLCLAVALVAAPLTHADAAPLTLPRDLTLARSNSPAHAAAKTDVTSPNQIGSSNVATADPLVPRPDETPCTDVLFSNASFGQYAPETFSYAPPAGCPGPYAKIVFNGNFAVTPGVQYDRTASVEIGNAPIFFGTTAEPGANLGPSWHVERDVTDDAALLGSPQTVEADIFNIYNSTYTGLISGTAFLQFYPARAGIAPAVTPNLVLPFPNVAGGPQHLATGTSTLTATYTLPKNIESLYMDVYAQSQQTDEQYFLCAPNNVAVELAAACGNGPLRETEIAIDGVPAGVAPVYPWIYTGGLDPYLWFPIPGVQTLEFKPYRLDLTPFAAKLDDGASHTVTMSVDNADNYFQGFGTLFAFRDPRANVVTGGLTADTIQPDPAPVVTENLEGSSPSVDGTIATTLTRRYVVAGYVKTSGGTVATTVASTVAFANEQRYSNDSATTGTLAVRQATDASQTSITASNKGVQTQTTGISFPLSLSLATVLNNAGTGTQVTTIDQKFVKTTFAFGPVRNFFGIETNEVKPSDTLDILDDEYITGNSNQSSSQLYDEFDTTGVCYAQYIAAANNVLTTVKNAPCNASADRAAESAAMHRPNR